MANTTATATATATSNRIVAPPLKPTATLDPLQILTLGPSPSPSSSASAAKSAALAEGAVIHYADDDGDDGGVRDMDLMCPICMQLLKDAFLTACGHSFCYMCIVTHLRNKRDCPCCSRHLTPNHIFPNFLLDKLLKKASARQVSKTASPIEKFRLSLQQVSGAERQDCKVTVKEIDAMISLLLEKKRRMEQEQAEKNMQVLLDFLHCLRKQKIDEMNEINHDLLYIKEDITAVERHRMELYAARERYSVKLRMLGDDPAAKSRASTVHMNSGGFSSGSRASMGGFMSGGVPHKKVDEKVQASSFGPPKKDALAGVDSDYISQSGLAVVRKKRIHAEFNDLLECYLKKRRQLDHHPRHDERSPYFMPREGYSAGLTEFQSVLSTFTRYSRLRVIAELKHGDSHPTNIVSSIEFDRDDELFATAGVSRRIKVFDYSSVVNEPGDAHVPVVEISTLSKLSCLSWNKFTKNLIASSDYEGVVAVWDVTTRQRVMEYEEHEKRAWSVDFSHTEPTMLISGSDDCKVKVWCTNQESSVINLDMKANICCVKYNPGSSYHVAVGCADHQIQYFDLRKVSRPLHVFGGHTKAVSYVKFLSATELASASTDSTLRLWDVNKHTPVRTFKGHTNEKNFVGLSANWNFISCGSETNDVFVYHKEISKPTAWHKFGSPESERSDEEAGYFISAVCWKNDSPTLISANSQGSVKVMVLAA